MDFLSVTEVQSNFKKPLACSSNGYKLLKLKNNITTLLISDPNSTSTSASICCGAGSFQDPANLPGMAHFVEHMLFMGTSEFPSPNDFLSTLISLGGKSNAYTMGDYTCFYFEVPLKNTSISDEFGLDYLMKIFSSFFRSPLFNENYMKLEIYSVDDEHQGNLTNDNKILYHGMRILANINHPFHNFATGTKKTLNSKKCRSEMISYFDKNFVSENMVLVLKSSLSLNQLQKMAIANFGKIEKTRKLKRSSSIRVHRHTRSNSRLSDSSLASKDYNFEIYPKDYTSKILFISQKETKKIRLIFPLYNLNDSFFENLWCTLLGDESKGSLCHHLKTMKMIDYMYVFIQSLSKENKVLTIDFDYKPLFELNLVIQLIETFINQVLSMEKESMNEMLSECSRVFKYQAYYSSNDPSGSMDEVSNYASLLQQNPNYNFENLIIGESFNYNGDVDQFTSKSIEIMKISNANVIILAETPPKGSNISVNEMLKDPYYNIDYQIYDLQYSPIELNIPKFRICEQNKFIQLTHHELDVKINESITFKKLYADEANDPLPKLLDYSKYHEIWHSTSNSLYITLTFQISFANISNTVENLINFELIIEYLGFFLKIEFYQGESALFSWGLFANFISSNTLSIEICGPQTGFIEFTKIFIKKIENLISNFKLDYKDFVKLKSNIRNNYEELENGETNKKVLAGSTLILEYDIKTIQERLEVLEIIDKSDLASICQKIIDDCKHTDILITGGDKNLAFKICKIINILTHHERIYLNQNYFEFGSSLFLRPGRNYDVIQMNTNLKDQNDVVYHYIQLCGRNDAERKYVEFFVYLLDQIVRYQLRTSKQLGYLVLSGLRINKSTIGLYILVNSSSYTYNEIMKEIDNLIFEFELRLLNMTKEQFAEQIELFAAKDNSCEEGIPSNIAVGTKPGKCSDNRCENIVHQTYLESILTKNYDFQKPGDNIVSFEYEDMMEFFRKVVSIKSRSRSSLSIFISSKIGKDKRKHDESKEMIESLLLEKNYYLSSLQLRTLLFECENDIGLVIKRLKNSGYKLSVKDSGKISKLLVHLIKFQQHSDESKEVENLQLQAVKKNGQIYKNNKLVIPHTELNNISELQDESVVKLSNDYLSKLHELFEDEDDYFDDYN
ncbi:AXL1 [Candida pseudojiufengensis]|uniref:AXL1 n=1 Tax=Candida pseudojiufengensis TaxID=497109 RepID=UPI002225B1BA|nr:AXL1 [Candida pseudojiufengensis]KAI5961852.1 AXL1 [Candida pseudojiufengensis]